MNERLQQAPVLYRLSSPSTGLYEGKWLIDRIINQPTIFRVVVFGLPGSGKSITLGELKDEASRILTTRSQRLHTEIIHYDDFYQQAVKQYGPRDNWQAVRDEQAGVWHKPQYDFISQNILRRSRESALNILPNTSTDRYLQMIELPGLCGMDGATPETAIRNRGVTTLNELADDNTLVIGLFSSKTTQNDAARVRQQILNTPDRLVSSIMLNLFNTEINFTEDLDIEKLGAKVKEKIAWSATGEDIEYIRMEIDNLAFRTIREGQNLRDPSTITIIQSSLPTPPLSAKEIGYLKRTGYLMETIIFDQLKLNPDLAGVFYNPHQLGIYRRFYLDLDETNL